MPAASRALRSIRAPTRRLAQGPSQMGLAAVGCRVAGCEPGERVVPRPPAGDQPVDETLQPDEVGVRRADADPTGLAVLERLYRGTGVSARLALASGWQVVPIDQGRDG